MCSTYALISCNETGVQTAETLLECMKMLDEELTLRGIPRPVVMCSDNHASRKDEKLLAFCKEKGIRLFFELANTSGFLQALGQFNKKYHMAYEKEKRRYKEDLKRMGRKDPHLSLADFLIINSEMWNTWWTPSDRRTAFRRVGILQNRIDSSEVDRSKFVMPLPPPVDTVPVRRVAESPFRLAKGTVHYWKAKYEAQVELTGEIIDTEVGPTEAGVLEPEIVQRTKSAKCKRITDGHGSVVLSKLLELRVEARQKEEAETVRKFNAAQERAVKKAAASEEARAQLEAWQACRLVCVCQAEGAEGGCPVAGLVLCPYCDTLKKRACRVGACRAAAQAEAELAAAVEGGSVANEE